MGVERKGEGGQGGQAVGLSRRRLSQEFWWLGVQGSGKCVVYARGFPKVFRNFKTLSGLSGALTYNSREYHYSAASVIMKTKQD